MQILKNKKAQNDKHFELSYGLANVNLNNNFFKNKIQICF
jgi:hypothetical protein